MANQAQINAASAVLKQFTQSYGATASDTMLANAVYSILAAAGHGGQPSAEYADAVAQATGNELKVTPNCEINGDQVTFLAQNILGVPAGTYLLEKDDEDEDLATMTKAEIVAQAEAEQIFDIDKGDPNKDTLIARLIAGRSQE